MLTWKKYTKDRLIAEHPAGFYVIKPQKEQPIGVPVFCGYCESITLSDYDEESHEKFGCCDWCANTWVYPKLDEWKSGWRPTRDEVEKYRSLRSTSL